MKLQEYKIEYDGHKVFFFEHGLMSARGHAKRFVKRNYGLDMRVYTLNRSSFGEKWLLCRGGL